MKFPGRRNRKHYFPVSDKVRTQLGKLQSEHSVYIVGLDQLLVDIEIEVDDAFLNEHNFMKGQSFIIDDELAEKIYWKFKREEKIYGEYPGGAIGNTLHNYAVLSDCPSIALGTIKKSIEVGDYAYKYLSKTNGLVDLSFLQPCDKPMGRALCFITPDSERTFAISKGCMNELNADALPKTVIKNSKTLLLSAYSLRSENEPIFHATIEAAKIAKQNKIPVVFSLGTSSLVQDRKDFLMDFMKEYVTIVAMNQMEAEALTGETDPLLACEKILESIDMLLLTVGNKGLYMAGYCDEKLLRRTEDPLHSKSIAEYNKFEYSRAMRKVDCEKPVKVYSHINPFMGGPDFIKNTNGAGDAALAAILHDISANCYHREMVPTSPKNDAEYLTYSSFSQNAKYANRVSFEVLIQNSPRLIKGLPEKEDSLEESYWRK